MAACSFSFSFSFSNRTAENENENENEHERRTTSPNRRLAAGVSRQAAGTPSKPKSRAGKLLARRRGSAVFSPGEG